MAVRVNIDEPRYDQNLYWGRAKHFFTITNPMNLFVSGKELDKSRDVVTRYRNGENMSNLSTDQLWYYKNLYDSAHHPETGERQIIFGRMSAQVPMNMFINGALLTYYRSIGGTIFWQWFNQSFNALVNYTNRSGSHPMPIEQLATCYVGATTGALVTALSLKRMVRYAPPILSRFVPFCAVAAANCVNIPMMRSREIREGIDIFDENNQKIGTSKIAAKSAISQVVLSRIGMCVPGMILPPIVMDRLEKRGLLAKIPWISLPLQVGLTGIFLIFTTPLCCALFPQKGSIEISELEPELQEVAKKLNNSPKLGFYNKGL